jgi:acyl carrier protein
MDEEALRTGLADVLEVEPTALTDDLPLTGDNWDSMAVVATLALIDEMYGVSVPPSALDDCASVGSLIASIKRAVSSEAPAP